MVRRKVISFILAHRFYVTNAGGAAVTLSPALIIINFFDESDCLFDGFNRSVGFKLKRNCRHLASSTLSSTISKSLEVVKEEEVDKER